MSPRGRTVLHAGLFLGAIALIFPIQALGDAHRPELPSSLLYTPDRRLMKIIACGHGPLLADLVWVQSTNYVMTEFKSGKAHIEHLYALYDVMTELDPDFVDAYVTGGVFLSAIVDEPDLSLRLLEKGHGRLDEIGGSMAEVTSGTIHRENKDRWKVLNEIAATHMVSLAGYAPTLEERYVEINFAGRLLLWGAKRYPCDRYSRPDYWEVIGRALAGRGVADSQGTKGGWYYAVLQIWKQRLYFTSPSSPLYALYWRRVKEVVSRQTFDKLESDWAKGRRPEKLPADELGVGYFEVGGKLVAPALDAALLERQLARDAEAFRRRHERPPASLDELRAFEEGEHLLRAAPPWVEVAWDAPAGTARVKGVAPR